VRDTGPGIPLTDQGVIFEPFRHADDSAILQNGGTGLGLSVSRELAMLMGGRLWVESEPGRGSTFHCILPLGSAGAIQAPEMAPAESKAPKQPKAPKEPNGPKELTESKDPKGPKGPKESERG
jgi:hypothetical protein